MTEPPAVGTGARLDFMGPLSAARADRLVRDLAGRSPVTVTDYGCGWGELLLRIVAATPGAIGTGIDSHRPDIERGRAAAAARNLTDRVSFIDGEAKSHDGTADLVISVGAYHAFGTVAEALAALRQRVRPGGTVLFGAELWERPPSPERLACMWPGMTADDCLLLPDMVDAATATGLRPLHIATASRDEWEDFESGYAAERESWLLANPGHSEAGAVRASLDEHRSIWLRGNWGLLGFAYLTLGAPVA